jgi:hypothetical protein
MSNTGGAVRKEVTMRKYAFIVLLLALVLIVGLAPGALAQAPPCNDTDGDGSPSGREYAAHHIVPLAQASMLGHDGHVPGSHHGFSACNPSGT